MKKTAYISKSIDALIKSVEDDPRKKFIFITNIPDTTPDAVCRYLNDTDILNVYFRVKIEEIRNMTRHNLPYKIVKMVEITDREIGEMLRETKKYFIEEENAESVSIEKFRKELLDKYPILRDYDDTIDYQEEVDYINNEIKELLCKDVLDELKCDDEKYKI
jgi:predicted nucleic acid-binding OB-fold protein